MNEQKPEKVIKEFDYTYEIQKVFLTIQGEGPFTGRRAIFIRLAGCNLQCPGCDTDYTSQRKEITIDQLQSDVCDLALGENYDNQLVVITGGEPFRQPIEYLIHALVGAGFKVQIETNGTLPLPAGLIPLIRSRKVYIICSPKTKQVSWGIKMFAHSFKYVIKAGDIDKDGLPIHALDNPVTTVVDKPSKERVHPIYLQPYDEGDESKNLANLEACVKSVLKHRYILQLQIHKIIGVE